MKIAVIGLGSAGARHARNGVALGHEVVGFDPAPTETPTDVRRVDSLEAAIAVSEAVIVASPSSLHAAQAIAALEAGKHVLVEKPLATTVSDAEKVAEAAERAGVVCGVAMNLRFHPGVLELKRLIDDGTLGTIRFAQASFGYDLRLWRPGSDYREGYSARSELGGGIVFDAIHELDYLLWLLGPVATVSAETAHVSDLEIDVEDIAVAVFRFESGAIGAADLNFVEPAYRRGCLLVGSAAAAQWDWEDGAVTVNPPSGEHQTLRVQAEIADTYTAELVDFFESVTGMSCSRTSAAEGVATVRIAEAIKQSSQLGRRVTLD